MKKQIPLFDLSRQNSLLKESLIKVFDKTLSKSEFTHGSATEKFENKFSELHDSKYAVALRSGTASLWVALKALDIKTGDEVITTPATFSATADAIVLAGATPVFADVLSTTGNIDPESVKEKVTKRTKAILVVHLYGVPADVDVLRKIAKVNNLALIEDASHAHGSVFNGKKVGSFGDLACFSLYPSKALGSLGNAGIILARTKQLRDLAEAYAHHGILDKKNKYVHSKIGMNELIDNLQAAFLLEKLKTFNKWIKIRRDIVNRYNKIFLKFGHPGMIWEKGKTPNFYVFAVQIKNRKLFREFMDKRGISTGIYYPTPLHLQKSYSFLKHKKGDFPVAEKFFGQTISLPLFPELKEEEISRIEKAIEEFFIANPKESKISYE